MKIKTRFAPSPTGYLHVGAVRTALYSWLFARNQGGKFILRIEDTDFKRSKPEAIKAIIDSMKWLNLEWDEGPYFQTRRLDRYNVVINEMLKTGAAYKCYCSKERLESLRKEKILRGEKPRYDGYCRYNFKHNNVSSYVVRFNNPKEGSISFKDQIRGQIKFNNQELDDLIIRRADGYPTYNFCVVIDDWDMAITHVIRGEDHINNTLRQINILNALNAPVPIYAHVSMINGSDGKKLSKRHGDVSVMQYRDDGYLPEALLNYLLRLGWSNGNKEIFSREEMIKLFSLNTISKSASIFSIDKLLWLNHYYINALPLNEVTPHLQWHIKNAGINTSNGPKLSELIKLLGKSCKTIKEIVEKCRYFYEEFSDFDAEAAAEYLCLASYKKLKTAHSKISEITEWTMENVNWAIQASSDELGVEKKEICMLLRVAVTGAKHSPPIDATIHAIGKNRSLIRINNALDCIARRKII